ncbi:MAG: TRAP transporter substrate-binding protein DctP [Deltaproteobacteria bacterium]|nr:TRAP transporter substrate-binding protein DctP [Deltaproteobacteria bacterium]
MAIVVCLIVAFAGTSLAAEEKKPIVWKVQACTPSGVLFYDALVRLGDKVKEITRGELVFDIYPAGALIPPFEGLSAVSDGTIQAHHGYSGMWVGKIPMAPLFNTVPGGFTALDQAMWYEHGGGYALYQEMYDKYNYNVKVFLVGQAAMENFQWAKKPLRTIEDFKGLKMRMMPFMGDILTSHGMSVLFMPGSEIMPNLQRGVIDSAEFSIPAFDKTLGLWEVCKYVMVPGIHQPGCQIEFIVNKDAYNALPDHLKTGLQAAVDVIRLKNWLWLENENLKAVEFFKQNGIEIVRMDEKAIDTMLGWADEYLDDMAAKDPFVKKIRESQKEWAKKWYPYHNLYNLPHK